MESPSTESSGSDTPETHAQDPEDIVIAEPLEGRLSPPGLGLECALPIPNEDVVLVEKKPRRQGGNGVVPSLAGVEQDV